MKKIGIGNFEIYSGCPVFFIAGPCVIEDESTTFKIAEDLKRIFEKHKVNFIFKASYDKANRSSLKSYRGPGLKRGLEILQKIKETLKIPVLSDVHRFEEIEPASKVLDVLQIPAFLCRQTDLILEVAKTNKAVNVKKGQFLAPEDMRNIVDKIESTGNHKIMLTERGTTFGYHNLVVDMRNFPIMRSFGYPVIFDATHSVQRPGGLGICSGGDREMIPYLLRSAVACGIDGVFMEVHHEPEKALCDGPNSLRLSDLELLLEQVIKIDRVVKNYD
ncbi:MAG: 3-deoxy-8-phosphooctulonate synthase [Proteobacteria bacterium]|nr:3-deoxy-8-phosphooctulonate synthase [Pseudomonadota bacterium]